MVNPAELPNLRATSRSTAWPSRSANRTNTSSAYGGITCFTFCPDRKGRGGAPRLAAEALHSLEDDVLLFFMGFSRSAGSILKDQKVRTEEVDPGMLDNLHYVKELGLRSLEALEAGRTREFGEIMHEHWEHKKRRSNGMSNPQIDEWYECARKNGAVGGKLVGAGGGGFLMFYAEDHRRLRCAMAKAGLTKYASALISRALASEPILRDASLHQTGQSERSGDARARRAALPSFTLGQFGRDCVMALSLANLTMLRVWSALLTEDPNRGYTLHHGVRPVDCAAAMIGVCVLAVLFSWQPPSRGARRLATRHCSGACFPSPCQSTLCARCLENSTAGNVGVATLRNNDWRFGVEAAVLLGALAWGCAMIFGGIEWPAWRRRLPDQFAIRISHVLHGGRRHCPARSSLLRRSTDGLPGGSRYTREADRVADLR